MKLNSHHLYFKQRSNYSFHISTVRSVQFKTLAKLGSADKTSYGIFWARLVQRYERRNESNYTFNNVNTVNFMSSRHEGCTSSRGKEDCLHAIKDCTTYDIRPASRLCLLNADSRRIIINAHLGEGHQMFTGNLLIHTWFKPWTGTTHRHRPAPVSNYKWPQFLNLKEPIGASSIFLSTFLQPCLTFALSNNWYGTMLHSTRECMRV